MRLSEIKIVLEETFIRLHEMAFANKLINSSGFNNLITKNDEVFILFKEEWPKSKKTTGFTKLSDLIKMEVTTYPETKRLYAMSDDEDKKKFWDSVYRIEKLLVEKAEKKEKEEILVQKIKNA